MKQLLEKKKSILVYKRGLSVVGGGAAFSPASIAGLQLWLDALDPATLFQDAALTTPAASDADPVGGWKDKSGANRHATQAVEAARLLLQTAEINGKNTLQGDNVNLLNLATASIAHGIGTGAFYWAGVVKAGSVLGNYKTFFTISGLNQCEIVLYNTYFLLNNFETYPPPTQTIAANGIYILELSRDGSGDCNKYVNGVLTRNFVQAKSMPTGICYVGAAVTGHPSNVLLGETLLYAGIDAVTRRAEIVAYLKAKWGISF